MKLRFAPSPTGFLHVGGAQTAIFNLLHARRHGGVMCLRIEDTDVERSKQHHAEQILASLKWLGCEWDEGPIYQSDRLDRYRERVFELVEKGLAYRCYCSVDDLEAERRAAEEKGEAFRYPGRCRSRTDAPAGLPFAVRIKVPGEAIELDDLIREHVRFEGELLDDFVLLRYFSGRTFTIVARNNSAANRYIQSAKLNGRALDSCWFEHTELANGGTLELELGPAPNRRWGVAGQSTSAPSNR